MKNLYLSLIISFVTIILLLLASNYYKKELNYEIDECKEIENSNAYRYIEENKTIVAYVTLNCCVDEIKISLINNSYKIFAIENDGKLCRCLCSRKITIYNAEKMPVILIDYDKTEIKLKFLEEEFCGISTYGKCENDNECIISGCSKEVCQSKFEEPIFTPCIFKECYFSRNHACKCVENKCQWIKIS